MKWINSFGLILQFLAFWFAAPELLGAATLQRFEAGLQKLIARLPVFLILIVVLAYGVTFTVLGVTKGIEAGKNGIEVSEYRSYIITMAVCSLLYLFFIIFYKRIKNWLEVKVAQPLTQRLIHNNETRKAALVTGAFLFTLGFIMQLIVVLLS